MRNVAVEEFLNHGKYEIRALTLKYCRANYLFPFPYFLCFYPSLPPYLVPSVCLEIGSYTLNWKWDCYTTLNTWQQMCGSMWEGGGQKENQTEGRRDWRKETERGKKKMTKVGREREGEGEREATDGTIEEEERWETERGGKRNGEEFRGSQTLCTPSTADATFCLAQWSVGLLYLYPHCVTSGPAQRSHTHTHTHLASGFCSSPAMTEMRQVIEAPCKGKRWKTMWGHIQRQNESIYWILHTYRMYTWMDIASLWKCWKCQSPSETRMWE